jgi:hypothetical protein
MEETPKGKHYTTKQIENAMTLLQANFFNYKKTQNETGIDRRTLTAWSKAQGLYALNKAEIEAVKANSEITIDTEQLREEIINRLVFLKDGLLKRMEKIMETSNNLEVLAKALKIVHEIDVTPYGPAPDAPVAVNYIQIIKNYAKQKNDGIQGHTLDRDNQEPAG